MIGRFQFQDKHHDGNSRRLADEREIRNELNEHRGKLTEWLEKRVEAGLAIRNHRTAIRQLERRASKLGITP